MINHFISHRCTITFFICHILENAQVTPIKMVHNKGPYSGSVFHALSHGVFRFVASFSFKNH